MTSRFCNFVPAAVVAVLGAAPFGTAWAQGATVDRSGADLTADCAGGFATLNGSGDRVTFRNACGTLTVNGSGNTIEIELRSGGTITLNGTGNRVSYAPVGGTAGAAVADHGLGNRVVHSAALPGGAPAGGQAAVAGNGAGLSVRGPGGESVEIGPNGVAVAPGGTAGATPPGALMLSGDHQNREMACAGAKVFISGDGGRFLLRG